MIVQGCWDTGAGFGMPAPEGGECRLCVPLTRLKTLSPRLSGAPSPFTTETEKERKTYSSSSISSDHALSLFLSEGCWLSLSLVWRARIWFWIWDGEFKISAATDLTEMATHSWQSPRFYSCTHTIRDELLKAEIWQMSWETLFSLIPLADTASPSSAWHETDNKNLSRALGG